MRYRTAFDDLFDVFRDFDDLFRRTFAESGASGTRLLSSGRTPGTDLAPSALTGRAWYPAVESFEKDGTHFLKLELPGVDPKDVNITLTGDHLHISGEKRSSRNEEGENLYFREARYGRFERSFRLPEGVRSEDVKARYENGVLELSIPVPEQVRPKSVKIQVGGDPKKIQAA